MEWETVIGLEIHAQLATRSKIFSGASTAFGSTPNTQACLVDLGYPGVLPVLNKDAVRMAVKFGLAVEAKISDRSVFARKNYFYPDLPKGYQISQYETPLCKGGYVEIASKDGAVKKIRLVRIHLEEDAGKNIHEAAGSLVDFNRSGVPLIEIVTKTIEVPGDKAAAVARAYVSMLRDLLLALGVSDVRMDQGSLRCDANVSLKPRGSSRLGTRTETKNVNSFRSVERAVTYEITRQAAVLSSGGKVVQETRHWHEDTGITTSGREKSDAALPVTLPPARSSLRLSR